MRGRFGIGVGTVMERSKLGYRDWAEAIYHMMTNAKGVSGMKVHRDLGIVQPAAWFLVQRLQDAMIPMAGSDATEGTAEADEACIDGREKNKHPSKKGKAKKAAVVGVRDRKTMTGGGRTGARNRRRPTLPLCTEPRKAGRDSIRGRRQGVFGH